MVPDDREKVKQNILRLFQGEDVGMSEYTALRKDGSTFPVLVRSTPSSRTAGSMGLRGFLLDITEQKRTEEALRESEEKYRQLFLTESDALVLLYTDTGEIIDVNDATLDMYGYGKEELLKLKITDISAEPELTWKTFQEHAAKGRGKVPLRYHKKKGRNRRFRSRFLRAPSCCGAVRSCAVPSGTSATEMRIEEELRKTPGCPRRAGGGTDHRTGRCEQKTPTGDPVSEPGRTGTARG